MSIAVIMRIAQKILLLVYPLTCLLWARGETVESRSGNIYLRDEKGDLKQITNSGKDHDPALSPDGARIVFVRNLLGDRDYNDFTRSGPATQVMQLWAAEVDEHIPPKLILDSPIEVKGRQFSGFYTPQFSGDQHQIYFLIQFAASSGAIVRLTLGTKEIAYVTDALEFSVVPGGKYKGDLIVKQHRPKLALGYYDWFYLLTTTGDRLGVIGQNKDDVDYFLDTYVGNFNECSSWNTADWLICVNEVR
jgi:hypothetical protein